MLDAELLERPAHLGQPAAVDLAARLGGMEVVRTAIRIEAHRQPVGAERLFQRPERRCRTLLLDQNCRIDRPRRVVQCRNEVERRLAFEPDVSRAVLMQHHPRQRPALPLPAMRALARRLRQKPARLQKRLGPCVAPGETVILHQVLMEVLGSEPRITLSVKCLDLLLPVDRNPLPRRLAQPPVH